MVTVASGVTVPRAGMLMAISPRAAVATTTVTGALRGSPNGAPARLPPRAIHAMAAITSTTATAMIQRRRAVLGGRVTGESSNGVSCGPFIVRWLVAADQSSAGHLCLPALNMVVTTC